VNTGLRWGDQWETDYSEDPGIDGRTKLNRSSRSGIGRQELD